MQASTFGELLKLFRKRTRMSQKDLARKLSKHLNTIGSWERGDCLPDTKAAILEVAQCLQLNEHETRQLLEASLTVVSSYWSVPFQRNPFFTGRDTVLRQLHAALNDESMATSSRSYALTGLGGIGKTQTVVEYAYRYGYVYTGVFWINAETAESLIASLISIADLLGLPESQEEERVMNAVIRWLNSHRDWLLIFDNVEDSELIQSAIPSARHGCLLFTSRRQALGTLTSRILDLHPMSLEDGLHFLLSRARQLDPSTNQGQLAPEEVAWARKIVLAMDGLPLALDQAGAYIEETGCTLAHYCTLYQTYSGKLLNQRGQSHDHPNSVVRTLALSIQQIEAMSLAAAHLLRFCAFLAPDAIPEELFLHVNGEYVGASHSRAFDIFTLNEALALLRRHSLLKRQAESGLLSIHRVVQEVLKAQMDQSIYLCWVQRTILLINQAFPSVEALTTWSQCQRLLPHALICATLIDEAQVVSEEAGRLLHQTGAYLLERAHYAQSGIFLRRARAIREQLLGSEHPDVAESLNYEAELAYYQGQYQQAEHLHLCALDMRERQLGATHPAVATSLHNLAGIYWIQGRYEEAEPLYQRALQLREAVLGGEHLDVGETLQNLAYLYFEQRRYEEAEPLYQRALAICEQILGHDHAYLVTLYNNLGKLSQALGKYFEAKMYYRLAHRLCKFTLPEKHPHLALTLSNLAALACVEGEWSQAREWYCQALQIREYSLGPDHPRTAQSLCDLAALYVEQGQDTQAVHLYYQALVIREEVLGPHHPATLQARESYNQICSRAK